MKMYQYKTIVLIIIIYKLYLKSKFSNVDKININIIKCQ